MNLEHVRIWTPNGRSRGLCRGVSCNGPRWTWNTEDCFNFLLGHWGHTDMAAMFIFVRSWRNRGSSAKPCEVLWENKQGLDKSCVSCRGPRQAVETRGSVQLSHDVFRNQQFERHLPGLTETTTETRRALDCHSLQVSVCKLHGSQAVL